MFVNSDFFQASDQEKEKDGTSTETLASPVISGHSKSQVFSFFLRPEKEKEKDSNAGKSLPKKISEQIIPR